MTTISILAAAAAILAGEPTDAAPAAPVPQDEPPPWAENELHWYWKDGLRFETADGAYAFELGGRVQIDAGFHDADDEIEAVEEIEDGVEIRRAYLTLEGTIHESWLFKAEYNFAGDVDDPGGGSLVDFADVYLGYADMASSEVDGLVGHFKEPFGLDELTSNKNLVFLERALPMLAFAPSRNVGVAFRRNFADDALLAQLGVFKADTNDGGLGLEDGGYALTGRLAGSPLYADDGEALLHLGAAYSMRDPEDEMVGYSARPEAHLLPSLLETGDFDADDVRLAGLEAGAVLGPFHASAEYVTVANENGTDADLDGYYVQAGWYLTGESRPYSRSSATWGGLEPDEPLGAGGCGAWELAARLSSVDLEDGAVDGGEADDVTLALNWYPNAAVRVMANYLLADVDTPAFDGDVDALLLRFQVAW